MILLNDIKNIAENPRGCHFPDAARPELSKVIFAHEKYI